MLQSMLIMLLICNVHFFKAIGASTIDLVFCDSLISLIGYLEPVNKYSALWCIVMCGKLTILFNFVFNEMI